MNQAQARERFAAARVARLATADSSGRPHLVPLVFAVDGDRVYSTVDAKPKRTTALRRLDNVRENPAVSLLVDHYEDTDWAALWWGTRRWVGARARVGRGGGATGGGAATAALSPTERRRHGARRGCGALERVGGPGLRF